MVEAIAIGASFVAGAAAVLSIAFTALSAERRAGKAETRAATLDANHSHVSIRLADTAAELKDAQERIDDLANELAKLAAAGPVSGSYWRLLQRLNVRRKADDDNGAADVHGPTAVRADADGLLEPDWDAAPGLSDAR